MPHKNSIRVRSTSLRFILLSLYTSAILISPVRLPAGTESPPKAAATKASMGNGHRDADIVPERANNDEAPAPSKIEIIGAMPALKLSRKIQRESGIATQSIEHIDYRPEQHAFGRVVDLQPLLVLRAHYAEARSESAVARAALTASEGGYRRLRKLHQQEAVSSRKLIEQRSQWQADAARLDAAVYRMRGLRETALHAWGNPIASWALEGGSESFRRILDGREIVLMLALPTEVNLPQDIEPIHVGRSGNRKQAKSAYYISPAPMTDTVTQGETYFFRTDAKNLRTGMRVDAWIPHPNQMTSGVLIPDSAVIWQDGKPWCYVQIDADHFVRRSLENPIKTGTAWFVEDSFSGAEKIVTLGAQMLLSEEFRRQIPDEDDD